MRIAMLTAGTRGDTQPYVALGRALARRGHEVHLAASEDHTDFVARSGLVAHTYRGLHFRSILEGEQARAFLARGALLRYLRLAAGVQHRLRREIAEAARAAVDAADAVIAHPLTEVAARALARHRGVPLLRTGLVPLARTAAFPSPLVPFPSLPGRALRRATHDLVRRLAWASERRAHLLSCAELGLEPPRDDPRRLLEAEAVPCAHLVSPTLLPRPEDWAGHHVQTGHCALDREGRAAVGEAGLAPDLTAWLDAGPPPVYLGFGSLPILDPPAFLRRVSGVTARLGVRALVSAGWSRLDRADVAGGHVFLAGALDHDLVLPRCLAAVHHGGLGTTTATLAAGLPTLVCAVFLDQPFWGRRVRALGAGDVVPFARLDAGALERGVAALLAPGPRARAREVAERMRAEDGLAATVDLVERVLARAR